MAPGPRIPGGWAPSCQSPFPCGLFLWPPWPGPAVLGHRPGPKEFDLGGLDQLGAEIMEIYCHGDMMGI